MKNEYYVIKKDDYEAIIKDMKTNCFKEIDVFDEYIKAKCRTIVKKPFIEKQKKLKASSAKDIYFSIEGFDATKWVKK